MVGEGDEGLGVGKRKGDAGRRSREWVRLFFDSNVRTEKIGALSFYIYYCLRFEFTDEDLP